MAVLDMTHSHYIGPWKSVEQKAFTFDPGVLVRSLHSIILAKTKVWPFFPGLITDVRRRGRERMPAFEEPFQVLGPTNESA